MRDGGPPRISFLAKVTLDTWTHKTLSCPPGRMRVAWANGVGRMNHLPLSTRCPSVLIGCWLPSESAPGLSAP